MEEINRIIAETFRINAEDLRPEMTPADIEGWDSLGQLRLISNLERRLGVIFRIEEIFEVKSLADLYRIIQRKKALAEEKGDGSH